MKLKLVKMMKMWTDSMGLRKCKEKKK